MIRFLDREVIGKGVHRSGWPWCIDALSGLESDGILFDDFVERSFIYEPRQVPYTEPWIGVFHHPPFIPNDDPVDRIDDDLNYLVPAHPNQPYNMLDVITKIADQLIWISINPFVFDDVDLTSDNTAQAEEADLRFEMEIMTSHSEEIEHECSYEEETVEIWPCIFSSRKVNIS